MTNFFSKYTRNIYGYNIGCISQMLSDILNSEVKDVTLSFDTLEKNIKHHPDLSEYDYIKLDEIIGKSNFVAKDAKRTVAIVLHEQSSQLYHYALKSTKSGQRVFLTSFRKTNKISVDKIRKKHKQGKVEILKDHLP